MARRSLTLVIDEELLQKARRLAAKRQTSVNELVRQHLEQLTSEEQRRLAAWEAIRHLVERPRARMGDRLPSRDELHER